MESTTWKKGRIMKEVNILNNTKGEEMGKKRKEQVVQQSFRKVA